MIFFIIPAFFGCAKPENPKTTPGQQPVDNPSDTGVIAAVPETPGAFAMPALDYAFSALEPHIDARTMQIHYEKHHAGYTRNLNEAIAGTPLASMKIEEILKDISKHSPAIRNNAGGYHNHNLFWKNLHPKGRQAPCRKLEIAAAIDAAFGSMDAFRETFTKAAAARFGSGWAWLILDESGALAITSTPNQDSPLMDVAEKRGTPLLALDVWEHAYYLHYQNRRADYIAAFFQVIHWEEVDRRYVEAKRQVSLARRP
jgi:Fe-Mn family superoxide dismutase